jgi:hypothetical protein
MDRDEADKTRPRLGDFAPAPTLRDAFVDALESGGRLQVEVVDAARACQGTDHDAVIHLAIKDWGVHCRRAPSPSSSRPSPRSRRA